MDTSSLESPPTSSTNPTTTTTIPGFTDHYAILRLGPSASAADIKAAYRNLRVEYFNTDAGKYRTLQAAFDVLVDGEARSGYDRVWRCIMGVGNLEIAASAGGDASAPLRVTDHVQRLNAKLGLAVDMDIRTRTIEIQEDEVLKEIAEKEKAEAQALLAQESARKEREAQAQRAIDESLKSEQEEQAKKDAGKGKKARIAAYKPVIGTKPYHSYIPIAVAYGDSKSHPRLLCWRPRYVLWRAKNSFT
ncbi:hypothetical protein BCR34DRAFT_606280 [Clohesyomyces aquaticus]|uniref:J domain-containing protein n=1 Tax=Clohesyomyces aquaticus TaxID=1231657 RepID=A0A1Y1YQT0_9PLEO|nr:hypothetical protein BCR34DRAFT_606280 [Clohesyomyces aquaticus]